MVTAPAKGMPIHPTIGDGSIRSSSDRNAEDFPQGPIVSSAWEGWWHESPTQG